MATVISGSGTDQGGVAFYGEAARPALELTIGCDVGQKRDPTAIAVLERQLRPARPGRREAQEEHFVARFLERLPLNTPYPQVARRVAEVVANAARLTPVAPTVFVDATGVGQPLVDTLVEAGVTAHAALVAVYFTWGDRLTFHEGGVTLGKARLVARLQVLLDDDRLHLPDTREARALAQELKDYEIRVDEQANDKYGAFRTGAHDDQVTALGLAVCWRYPQVDWSAFPV